MTPATKGDYTMPYVMPWHLGCLAEVRIRTDANAALLRLLTAYPLRTFQDLGTNHTPKRITAMIRPEDLFLENHPNDRDSHYNWTIKRAPADRALPLIVMSRECFGIRTHYWAGRTGPCIRAGCDACKAGRLSRWTGYLACIEPADGSQVLFEYTPPAAEQLQKLIAAQGYLRGTKLLAARSKKVKNARVIVTARGLYEHMDTLPPAPDILPILFHIWGIRSQEVSEVNAYDRDSLPESERPKRPRRKAGLADLEADNRQLVKDLAGQLALPIVNSNNRRDSV